MVDQCCLKRFAGHLTAGEQLCSCSFQRRIAICKLGIVLLLLSMVYSDNHQTLGINISRTSNNQSCIHNFLVLGSPFEFIPTPPVTRIPTSLIASAKRAGREPYVLSFSFGADAPRQLHRSRGLSPRPITNLFTAECCKQKGGVRGKLKNQF